MIPTKKISLTLIEYAQPLINDLPRGYSKSDLDAALKLATVVWNACVLDQWHKNAEYVAAVRRQIAQAHPVSVAIVDALIERKTQLFGGDNRGITNEHVVFKGGEFVVRAEARIDLQYIDVSGAIN